MDIQEKYPTQFNFEVLSGGMVIGDRIGTIRDAAPPNILEIYERISSFTGTTFSPAYLANVKQGDSIRNSEIPANALAVFKSYLPQKAIAYAHALQQETAFQEAARYEFSLAKQLQVTAYPQLLVQAGEMQFYLIAKGYTDFANLDKRIQKVLAEIEPEGQEA